jgi:mycothiol synthase
MTLEATKAKLTGDFIARPTQMEDLEAVFALVQTFMLENFGMSNQTLDDLRSEWESPRFDVSKNTRSVYTPEDQLVGYVEVWDTHETPVRPFIWGYVHPDYRGRGIGRYLIQWSEQRARQVLDRVPPEARVVAQTDSLVSNEAAKALFEAHGFATNRRSWLMLIEFDAEPEAPLWPEGITVTTMADLGDTEAVFHAVRDSFQDHRGHVEQSVEAGLQRFQHWIDSDPNHDPTFWLLAMDGDRIAGISLCREKSWDDPEASHVNTLGVLREYRRRGIALALLKQSFLEAWKRGQKKVSLGVDASSLTGATRLYEKAGMHIYHAFDEYEKELRPGVELSNQG